MLNKDKEDRKRSVELMDKTLSLKFRKKSLEEKENR